MSNILVFIQYFLLHVYENGQHQATSLLQNHFLKHFILLSFTYMHNTLMLKYAVFQLSLYYVYKEKYVQ